MNLTPEQLDAIRSGEFTFLDVEIGYAEVDSDTVRALMRLGAIVVESGVDVDDLYDDAAEDRDKCASSRAVVKMLKALAAELGKR